MTAELALRLRPRGRPEVVAGRAVSDVELMADDGEPHRMGAVQELPVFDCVAADIGRNLNGAPRVPARAMPRFGRSWLGDHLVCWGTYPGGSAAPSPKKKS